MQIRLATLDDTASISALFCGHIDRWQRLNAQGQPEDVDYAALTIYERWLHGGEWMSIETGAIWLSHMLSGAGLPYVMEQDGELIGYAELFPGEEPEPFGVHVHIGQLVTREGEMQADFFLRQLVDQAHEYGRVTVSAVPMDSAALTRYRALGLEEVARYETLTLSAQTGQGFYRASAHSQEDAAQIAGWAMPVGRVTSSREQWERLWVQHWSAVPQITARKSHRIKLFASGQDAYVCLQQHLYDSRTADVYCWTSKPFNPALLVAIRDWAHRQGLRTLNLTVSERIARTMLNEAESTRRQRVILARDVNR